MIHALIMLLAFFHSMNPASDSLKTYYIQGLAQGTSYHISYTATDSVVTKTEIENLLHTIDGSLSLYKTSSLINQFNTAAHGIQMDQHLKTVVQKAIEISTLSNGSFDITCKPIIDLWKAQQSSNRPPTHQTIKKTLRRIGYQNLILKGDSLLKKIPSLKIDCDGIAQGYTVDQLALIFQKKNIENYIIELGGEVYARGKPLLKTSWEIAVQPTVNSLSDHSSPKIALSNKAITTSGSMNKFLQLGKEYFSHVVNPLTGYPVPHKIISVTVVANDAITADALDNALMVMGMTKAFKWIANNPEIGLYIHYVDDKGNQKEMMSDTIQKYMLR
jgi:FAD:protein FMN transferase